jgi:hypothetical protein
MLVLVSNHFVDRYRERILDMNPAMWKVWDREYKHKLRMTLTDVLNGKAKKIAWGELPEDVQEYHYKKYGDNSKVIFKYKNTVYIGSYVKNEKSHEECVLLLTALRLNKISKITSIIKQL